MANYVTNDRGIKVVAVGMPGSVARMKCEHPQFIDHLSSLYFQSESNGEFLRWAFRDISQKFSGLERDSMMEIAQAMTV